MKRSRRIQFAKCSFDATDQGSIALNKWISRTGFMQHYVTTKKYPVQERGPQLWGAGTDCVCTHNAWQVAQGRFLPPYHYCQKYQTWKTMEREKSFEIKKIAWKQWKRDTSERFFSVQFIFLCYLRFDGFIGVFVPLSPVIKPQFKQEKCTLSMICWWFYNRFLMLIFLR